MRVVGIRLLKNKLSEYVRLASSGETVLLTDRDRVVAELRPPDPDRAMNPADALLAEAMRSGLLSAPAASGAGVPPRQPVMALATLLEGLARDRDER